MRPLRARSERPERSAVERASKAFSHAEIVICGARVRVAAGELPARLLGGFARGEELPADVVGETSVPGSAPDEHVPRRVRRISDLRHRQPLVPVSEVVVVLDPVLVEERFHGVDVIADDPGVSTPATRVLDHRSRPSERSRRVDFDGEGQLAVTVVWIGNEDHDRLRVVDPIHKRCAVF